MRSINLCFLLFIFCLFSLSLSSCSTTSESGRLYPVRSAEAEPYDASVYASRLPQSIHSGEKVVLVDPRVHAWGAYGSDGSLIKGGLATAGSNWCPDLGRPCHTRSGSFRVYSLGSPNCKSSLFPIPRGGAPMPYCMFFNKNQAMHGSHDHEVVDGNISHGCVRMHVSDAEWLRYNFVNVGTKVIVKPY